MSPYAEVIGDPVAHSRSPMIHGFWLRALGLPWDYRATRVPLEELEAFITSRRADPDWRGCSITAPLKETIGALLDEVSDEARAIGAVNCAYRRDGRLVGLNTDVDGIAETLAGLRLRGRRAVIIGAGGGARAALHYLAGRELAAITLLVRTPAKASGLAKLAGRGAEFMVRPFEEAAAALEGAALVINATPLGMTHAGPQPAEVLASLARAAPGFAAFDMVYQPIETEFLRGAAAAGGTTLDGLRMLVGQARHAFGNFFGVAPPLDRGRELRQLLLASSSA